MTTTTNSHTNANAPQDKKRNGTIQFQLDPENGAITITAAGVANAQPIVIATGSLSPAIRNMALLHGLKQKIGDAAAIARNPDTGRSATAAEKWAAVQSVASRLVEGQWNQGERGATGGILAMALLRLYPTRTPEDIAAYLAKRTDGEKTALRTNPKIAAIIDDIRRERGVQANINTDALLDELGGGDEEGNAE